MQGDKKVIEMLNKALIRELAAINQYIVHARILESKGMAKLGKLEYEAAIEEMKHADELIKRILFLEGIPDIKKMGAITIGKDVKEIVSADLKAEYEAIPFLKEAVKVCEELQDYSSRELLVGILTSEEKHIDWLETQKELMEKVGLENYRQSQIDENLK